MSDKTLRLILGDQLNAAHSWFKTPAKNTLYVIAELHQEASYTCHHIQKIAAFFAAMEGYANALKKQGFDVLHLTLDDTQRYKDLPSLLNALCEQHGCSAFDYQRPDEKRLLQQLRTLHFEQNVSITEYDTEHFLLPFHELNNYITPAKHNRMESFYRKMRKRFHVMVDGNEPWGGKWNFDTENRQSFKAKDLAHIPTPLVFSNNIESILDRIRRHKIATLGSCDTHLPWPVSRKQSLDLLNFFCSTCLPYFGQFQDAMTTNSPHAWSLYHSRLSFALNAKMLHPQQVINAAISTYQENPSTISLAQVEGFVRQILGWREYVRAVYWANSEHYNEQNVLNATRPLPSWFWNGETKMNCMQKAIGQSLDHAYAHHIQRLMITGNFALLAGINPDDVEAWYLGIYIDAIEWVEQPNTRSMALLADGGWVATKPYIASANYINKMSDYCKTCHYKPKERTGENACPFNSLYWHFLDQHKERFANNPRLGFTYKSWTRMGEENQHAVNEKAKQLLKDIEAL